MSQKLGTYMIMSCTLSHVRLIEGMQAYDIYNLLIVNFKNLESMHGVKMSDKLVKISPASLLVLLTHC